MKKYIAFLVTLASLLTWGLSVSVAYGDHHRLGSNVLAPDGAVYLVTTENNQTVRRPYTSSGAFLSYSFNTWKSIVPASSEDLSLTVGSFIQPQDGSVFCSDRGTDKSTCYFISQGRKYGFTNEYVFKHYGFDFKFAKSGDVSWLPLGNAVIASSTQAHPVGSLIFFTSDKAISQKDFMLVGSSGLYKILNKSILQDWGYNPLSAAPANSLDKILPIVGEVQMRQPGQLNILNTIAPYLEFRSEDPLISEPGEDISKWKATGLSGDYLINASVKMQAFSGFPETIYIHIELNQEGTALLSDITSKNIGKPLGIFLDGRFVSAPHVLLQIQNGQANFNWNSTLAEANNFVGRLNLLPNIINLPPETQTPSSSQSLFNDAKRLADVRQMASALELYFNDHNSYPLNLSDTVPIYIGQIPNAPLSPDGICTLEQNMYKYTLIDVNKYNLTFCLGNTAGGYKAGIRTLSELGIK